MGMMNIVLVLAEDQRKSVRLCIEGFQRLARRNRWNIQMVERDPSGDFPDVERLLEVWQPIGAVVFASSPEQSVREDHFGKVPVVYVDSMSLPKKPGANRIVCDSTEIGRLAAREFDRMGFRSFAYAPCPHPFDWCRQRERGFADVVRKAGGRFCRVGGRRRDWSLGTRDWLKSVEADLAKLPKPCALLAANDSVAMQIINYCHRQAIAVPEEIAVMGVDNDEAIDFGCEPSITSIEPDFVRGGHAAAAMLERLIRVPGSTPDPIVFSARRIVRRASTSMYVRRDFRVRDAVDYIRRHAADGIGVKDVVREMKCSRRLAELRFRETLDHSILEEILLARVDFAMNLLDNTKQSVPSISDSCGFGSVDAFRRAFIRIRGMGPQEYRIRSRL